MFPVSSLRNFRNAGRASVVESLFREENSTEESFAFHNSVLNEALLEIFRNSLLIGVACLQTTCCNATKNEILTKFLQGVLKISKNF